MLTPLQMRILYSSLCAALIPAISVIVYLWGFNGESMIASVIAAACLFLLFIPYFLLMSQEWQFLSASLLRMKPKTFYALPVVYVVVYLAFALGTRTFNFDSMGRLVLFLFVPWVCVFLANRFVKRQVSWLDALAIFAIWLPFDTGLIKTIWLFPAGEGAYVLNSILAVGYAVLLFRSVRMIKDIGYRPEFTLSNVLLAAKYFAIFLVIALVFGFSTGFIKYNGNLVPAKTLAVFPGILLFIAIPEELLFRGLFQNLLQQTLKKPYWALGIAAVVFGLTHANNGAYPDWRYVVLATVAGFIYGLAYQRTKNLTAAVLLHAAVDAVWVGYFM